jgi:hypothetical protein
MYLVNERLYASLTTSNLVLSFYLAMNGSEGRTTLKPVNLPYAAFDLATRFPLAGITEKETNLRYFPLKRAVNNTQYVLGRTFN